MDESLSLSSKMGSEASKKLREDHNLASKRRKVEKTVVSVRIKTSAGKAVKNEGPPTDSWSWRKYGQKTIKGSPYPRGYYRCSTSKGCLAKKQVERCRTDASMVIITYTCSHNHPGPDISSTIQNQTTEKSAETHEIKHLEEVEERGEIQNLPTKSAIDGDGDGDGDGDRFHYIQSPTICLQVIVEDREEDLFAGNSEKTMILLEEKPISCSKIEDFSKLELSEENDFFDELEELPAPPSLTSFLNMRSSFPDERIPVAPSVISGPCFQS